jgi:hypothetical protein
MTESRHPLVYTQRGLFVAGVVVAVVAGVFLPHLVSKIAAGALAVACVLGLWWQARRRPLLIVDDNGYRIEVGGERQVSVRWSEVKKVRADAAEHALLVDCGEPARNLHSPSSGYGFRWRDAGELYQRVVAAVPDRVELVEKL